MVLISSCGNCFIFRLVKMDPLQDNQDDTTMDIINADTQYDAGDDDDRQYLINFDGDGQENDGQDNVVQENVVQKNAGEVYLLIILHLLYI